jgi:hypothetical protein
MSTPTQISANQSNAQHSTGPKTEAGKGASSMNNFRHGLAGSFMILDWEKREEFDELFENLRAEHQPAAPTEALLVESMAQHYWLKQRALRLQHTTFTLGDDTSSSEKHKLLALYLRYQTTHERAFHKCLNQLLKLRAEKRKQEIGFESQKQKQANEVRKQELHTWNVLFAKAKVDHRILLNHDAATPENRPVIGIQHIIAAEKAA